VRVCLLVEVMMSKRKTREVLTHPSRPHHCHTASFTALGTLVSYISGMSTDLPYAMDAQVSLSYDELKVRVPLIPYLQHSALSHINPGPLITIPERTRPVTCHRPDQVQLRMGPCEILALSGNRGCRRETGAHGNDRERKHVEWNFKSPPAHIVTASSSLSFIDLARQLRYVVSSTYDLHLASGCYSDEKEDKSDGRRCNSKRRRSKSDVEEDKSYRGGVQHLKKRKEDVGGEGISFSLCAAPLDRLSPCISEEQTYDGGVSRSRSRS